MMKKLLVLSLVLAVAGLANAGLLVPGLSYEVDEVAGTVSLIADAPVIGITLGALIPDAGTLSAGTVAFANGGPGDMAENLGMVSYPAGTLIGASGSTGTSTGITGVIVTFGYAGTNLVVIQEETEWGLMGASVDFQDGTSASLVGSEIIIPEPMTMVLLGLGGLFIRRK